MPQLVGRALQDPSWRWYGALGLVLIAISWHWIATTSNGMAIGPGAPAANQLEFPRGVAVDGAGNVYIADTTHNRVRKIAANSVTTTVAGNGRWGYSGDGGPATEASLYGPWGLAVDEAGNLYIADYVNDRIRKLTVSTGVISTVAGGGDSPGDGGPATHARLNAPYAVAVDGGGNLYIADADIQRIRRVSAATGCISTILVGGTDGLGDEASQLDAPTGIAADTDGNLYIADRWRHRIREVSATTGKTTVVAGSGPMGIGNGGSTGDGGPATRARLNCPAGVAVDRAGNVYVVDSDNERVRRISSDGLISTVVGLGRRTTDGGLAAAAALFIPASVAVDAAGNLYILEITRHRVRRVSKATGVITTVGR
jgi:sugar lactone lactonase YvrE